MAKVDYEQFVRLWFTDEPTVEIARKMGFKGAAGMTYHANKLRKLGVKLPKRNLAQAAVDVSSLNSLVAELAN